MLTYLLIIIIALALIFDFINGFHDAANAIATIVSTKVLTPLQAVLWSSAFNFLVYFVVTEHKIANTIAKTVNEQYVTPSVILSALIAAIFWNLLTWWRGIPSSSSHTLIGGFAGAGIMNAWLHRAEAVDAVNLHYVGLIAAYIVLAPFIGMGVAFVIAHFVGWIMRRSEKMAQKWFKAGQLVSSAALSFAHGGNDAQKVMAIIYVAMTTAGDIAKDAPMPGWIPLACYTMIALGTLSGGWRIVKTVGFKITRLTPAKGVSAETAGALTLFLTQYFGIPVSTTHTLAGSIVGVGLAKSAADVKWDTMRRMAWAWVMTIPVSATIAALIYGAIHLWLP